MALMYGHSSLVIRVNHIQNKTNRNRQTLDSEHCSKVCCYFVEMLLWSISAKKDMLWMFSWSFRSGRSNTWLVEESNLDWRMIWGGILNYAENIPIHISIININSYYAKLDLVISMCSLLFYAKFCGWLYKVLQGSHLIIFSFSLDYFNLVT